MTTDLRSFPATSFLRIFHAPRPLTADEVARVRAAMTDFLPQWVSHEAKVTGAFEILYDRFLVVAANEDVVPLSGCSKDSLVGQVRALGAQFGVELVHAPPICFRDGDGIECVDRGTFGELVASGRVTGDTIVFDNTVYGVGAFKDGRWEVPASACWHAQAYELGAHS